MSKCGSTNEAYEMDITFKTPPIEASNKMDDSENDKDDSKSLESGTSETKTEVQRDGWSNQIEFIMCTMGYAVGLGNVWRFPYLVYKNGGGTFLIPYFTSLLFIGLPVFFLELALGQFSGQGPVRLFGRISPIFKGLGWAMLSATIFVSLYYNVIMAWTLFYMIKGFSSELPWSSCTSDSSNHCVENFTNIDTNDSFAVGPSEDFFLHQMLGIDKAVHNWDNFGTLQWKMILCLFAAWTIICLCLIKGVQSAGKVVYFTATFPFLVLIIFFIYGLTLDGAEDGIHYYITPDYKKLLEIDVWADAATQIFYSLGVACGTLPTLSSYNRFNNNCHRDALLIGVINCCTSFFAGFAIFAILGFMAKQTGQNIEDVVKSGSALAFVAYPEACTYMPLPPIWSFLFFFMLLILGIGSMLAYCASLTTAIIDEFSLTNQKHYVAIVICFIMFVGGITMCFSGGLYMFDLLDNVSLCWNIMLCALLELVIVVWMYGVNNFLNDIKQMEIKIPIILEYYWKACWCFITPLLITFLIVMKFIQFKPYHYGDYVYPDSIQALAWLIPSTSIVILILIGIYQIGFYRGKGFELKTLFQPSRNWGPQKSS